MRFPEGFISSLQQHQGFDELGFTTTHQSPEMLVSIRLNKHKFAHSSFQNATPVPWCTEGLYLESRPSFTLDPHFHAGAYYVQEASSMFVAHIIEHLKKSKQNGWKVLDLCAAPGGKSTLLASHLNTEDLLLANEIIKTRVPVLCNNLTKWGNTNVCVSNNDPKDFERLGTFFDVILVDAPCSGSGMFRKDPETMQEWTPENVAHCAARQERILHDIYPTLENGGYLIYATCSYSEAENEAILDKLCTSYSMESIQVPMNANWGIIETISPVHKAFGYKFYPNKVKGEGFFIACLQKKDDDTLHYKYPKFDFKKVLAPVKDYEIFARYITNPTNFAYLNTPDGICAVQEAQLKDILWLQKNLYLKKSGVKLGKIAGKDIIPDHELALSQLLSKKIPLVNLDIANALSYLRKEDLILTDTPLGWQIVAFENCALGWMKILPKRVNNYYPKALRILMK